MRIFWAPLLLLAMPWLAHAEESPWSQVDWQELGLTQSEWQQVRESDMTPEELNHLLEIGIRPGEYFTRPWEKLGTDETTWLTERSEGMNDADIDRTFELADAGRRTAAWSLLLPSFYQWRTQQHAKALGINSWSLCTLGGAAWLGSQSDPSWRWLALASLGANLYSFLDGMSDHPRIADDSAGNFTWAPLLLPESWGLQLASAF